MRSDRTKRTVERFRVGDRVVFAANALCADEGRVVEIDEDEKLVWVQYPWKLIAFKPEELEICRW